MFSDQSQASFISGNKFDVNWICAVFVYNVSGQIGTDCQCDLSSLCYFNGGGGGGGLLLEQENAYNANGLVLNSHFAGFVSQT